MKIPARFFLAVSGFSLIFISSCATNRSDPEVLALQPRAEKGDVAAQRTLGGMFDSGQKIKRDYVQAAKWYRMAADQGDAIAQNNLASYNANGLGMATNLSRAVELYRKSAEQGYALAQNSLGGHYYYGWGVAQDRAQAFKWFRISAEQGNVNAMQNLSNLYRLGAGTDLDLAESYKWAEIAAILVEQSTNSNQKRDAQRLYASLKRTLPPEALVEGHLRSQKWLASFASHPVPASKFLEH